MKYLKVLFNNLLHSVNTVLELDLYLILFWVLSFWVGGGGGGGGGGVGVGMAFIVSDQNGGLLL